MEQMKTMSSMSSVTSDYAEKVRKGSWSSNLGSLAGRVVYSALLAATKMTTAPSEWVPGLKVQAFSKSGLEYFCVN